MNCPKECKYRYVVGINWFKMCNKSYKVFTEMSSLQSKKIDISSQKSLLLKVLNHAVSIPALVVNQL